MDEEINQWKRRYDEKCDEIDRLNNIIVHRNMDIDTWEAKLEDVLATLYAMDCNSLKETSVSYAVAHLCDEELDRSGRLLGRIRDKAYKKLEA